MLTCYGWESKWIHVIDFNKLLNYERVKHYELYCRLNAIGPYKGVYDS